MLERNLRRSLVLAQVLGFSEGLVALAVAHLLVVLRVVVDFAVDAVRVAQASCGARSGARDASGTHRTLRGLPVEVHRVERVQKTLMVGRRGHQRRGLVSAADEKTAFLPEAVLAPLLLVVHSEAGATFLCVAAVI
ncbi:hypothetical protein L596_028982 [Steinernema carpocapsae]|uniref:Uncharacterized protein n=1 Tax=Steinernema carpocapsae TaxID=34508 RepID=A0A4U5LTA1_STECR|nr:hypothetical protein L596_028982 [Steinernema carpocapsae]